MPVKSFKCILVTPVALLVDSNVWQVSVLGEEERFSIRADHAPIITSIKNGFVEVAFSEENRKRFTIVSGILKHENNTCTIICNDAEDVGQDMIKAVF